MDRGAVRSDGRSEQPAGVHPRPRRGGVEPLLAVLEVVAHPVEVGRVRGHDQGSALGELAVDPVLVGGPADLVDRGPHGVTHGVGGHHAVALGEPFVTGREQRRAPATVSARSSEGQAIRLEDDDPQCRVGIGEVSGRPHSRVAAADDGDIGGRGACRRSRVP